MSANFSTQSNAPSLWPTGPAFAFDLPPEITERSRRRSGDDTLDLQEQERSSIVRALERFGGNRRRAAAALNISTVTLWRKMKQYGLAH